MERITRQYAEVLRAGDGKARISRQYVEVLRAVAVESAVYTIALTDHLGITDTAVGALPAVEATVADTFAVADEVTAAVSRAMVATTHDLGITDSVSAVVRRLIRVSLVDDLSLTQSSDEIGPQYLALQSALGLQEQLQVEHRAIYHVAITDTLALTDKLGKDFYATVHDTFTATDAVSSREWSPLPGDSFAMSDSITAYVVRNGRDTFVLEDTIGCTLIAKRTTTHDLRLVQSLAYVLDNHAATQNYTPFVGTSDGTDFTPPTTVVPTLGHKTLTLTYPFVSPTTTLLLRNPEFGNLDRLAFNRVNRNTRGGTLVIFADPRWPKMQTLQLKVIGLSQSQADGLLDFFRLSLGKEIGLLDHEGRQWRGIITTPDAEVSHVGREDRSVGFDFEGVLA